MPPDVRKVYDLPKAEKIFGASPNWGKAPKIIDIVNGGA